MVADTGQSMHAVPWKTPRFKVTARAVARGAGRTHAARVLRNDRSLRVMRL